MTLQELVAELDALRADHARLGAIVRGDRLLELVIAKLQSIDLDGESLDGPELDTTEAGRLLNLSPKTVERLCRQRKIPARKTSSSKRGRWRITRAALQDYRTGRIRPQRNNLKLWGT
jgi:excisionase family DNA binding protein